jgi:hypothetical protein
LSAGFTFMADFLKTFRAPPWSNEHVRWPIRWLAWVVAFLGAVALAAAVGATAVGGVPRGDYWFVVKVFCGAGYLTALSTYVGWHSKAPAGWIPWIDATAGPPNTPLECSRER